MSLESFAKKEVAEMFKFLRYKNFAYVLLALEEMDEGRFAEIQKCINRHRITISNASLRKTLDKAREFDLITDPQKNPEKFYRLTNFGHFIAHKIQKLILCLNRP